MSVCLCNCELSGWGGGRSQLRASGHLPCVHGLCSVAGAPVGSVFTFFFCFSLASLHVLCKMPLLLKPCCCLPDPAPPRVRALHFLCTIRCDREDIQVGWCGRRGPCTAWLSRRQTAACYARLPPPAAALLASSCVPSSNVTRRDPAFL
jgi:hypothetical protein